MFPDGIVDSIVAWHERQQWEARRARRKRYAEYERQAQARDQREAERQRAQRAPRKARKQAPRQQPTRGTSVGDVWFALVMSVVASGLIWFAVWL